MTNRKTLVACPQCGKEASLSANNRYRPFCSERCKMIDLGQWATESYRIPAEQGQNQPDDLSGQA